MNPQRLLVVDDDVDFAESLADVLHAHGFQVGLAHSGEECLRLAAAEPFSDVVLDMKMPGMSGMECLIALRRVQPGIPVVLVTAFTRSELMRQALHHGAIVVLDGAGAPAALAETVSLLPGGRALLLEHDDPAMAGALSAALTGSGYRVDRAETVQAAQSWLSGQAPDLLVLSDRYPQRPTADLLLWLDAQSARPAVVAVTDVPCDGLRPWPFLSPRDVLVKPFQPGALLGVLARHESAARRAAPAREVLTP